MSLLLLFPLSSCLLTLSRAANYVVCPSFACGELPHNFCAKQELAGTITLSVKPCEGGFACTYSAVAQWFLSPANATSLLCQSAPTVELPQSWQCPSRKPLRNLATGSYPKACLSNSDCTLQDGSSGECTCTLISSGSTAYCRPDINASYFDAYWEVCKDETVVINGQYGGYYWYLRTQFALLFDAQGRPDCAGVLWEFQQLEQATTELTSAGTVTVLLSVCLFI